MKKILIVLFIIPFFTLSQTIDSIQQTKINYEPSIVKVEKTKEEIYSKITSWINRYYKNPELVIKANEKDTYLRLSSISTYSFFQSGINTNSYSYDLEISIQDGKYKVEFFNIHDQDGYGDGYYPACLYNKKGEYRSFKKVSESLEKGMLQSIKKIHFEIFDYIIGKKEW